MSLQTRLSKLLFEETRAGLAVKHLLVVVQLAGALKLWLECLPEPLIRPDLSRILVQAICCLDSEADRMHVMQQVLIHVSLLSSTPLSQNHYGCWSILSPFVRAQTLSAKGSMVCCSVANMRLDADLADPSGSACQMVYC